MKYAFFKTHKGLSFSILSVTLVAIVVSLFIFKPWDQISQSSNLTTIRLGWQVPWATQGQLVQTMNNTQIPKDNGLKLDLVGFESGAPLNEAAVGGKVDVLLTADQPAITLISKQPTDWKIIGRLMYNRVSIYVPTMSSITSVSDLKDKTVGVPFGTAAQKNLILSEKNAGLIPGTDVTNSNVGILEQSALVNDAQATKWGNFDALAGFDPTPAVFVSKGFAKYISTDKVVSVVVMSTKFIDANPGVAEKVMQTLSDTYAYYRNNATQANAWYKEGAKLNIDDAVLNDSASIEPNLEKANDIRVGFNDDDLTRMQITSDFLYNNKLINSKVVVNDYILTAWKK